MASQYDVVAVSIAPFSVGSVQPNPPIFGKVSANSEGSSYVMYENFKGQKADTGTPVSVPDTALDVISLPNDSQRGRTCRVNAKTGASDGMIWLNFRRTASDATYSDRVLVVLADGTGIIEVAETSVAVDISI